MIPDEDEIPFDPRLMNRAARRARGWRGPLFTHPPQFIQRIVRRKYARAQEDVRTRRVRKAFARVEKALHQRGIA